jgi:hypothetical protein
MPPITGLAYKVIAGVLRKLNNVWFLLPTILICHHFYLLYKKSPSAILNILQQQIILALLPYAITASKASCLFKTPHLLISHVGVDSPCSQAQAVIARRARFSVVTVLLPRPKDRRQSPHTMQGIGATTLNYVFAILTT